MSATWFKSGGMSVLLMVSLVWTASAQPAAGPAETRDPNRQAPGPALANEFIPAPEYWLGLECLPVPAILRTQLDLPEKQGLLVESVVSESPAAKAGIVRHDILWAIGEKPLMNPVELVKTIDAAKGEKVSLEVIHAGKRQTIEVTPAKRPEDPNRKMVRMPGEADWNTIQKWMDGQWPGEDSKGIGSPLRFRVFHPGAILPQEPMPAMPDNMSIVISKEGSQPAKIIAKIGEEKWEVNENELDKLPPNVRRFVDRMMGRGPLGVIGIERSGNRPAEATSPDAANKNATDAAAFESRMEQRMEEMNRRLERMMKSLEPSGQGESQPNPSNSEAPVNNPPAEK